MNVRRLVPGPLRRPLRRLVGPRTNAPSPRVEALQHQNARLRRRIQRLEERTQGLRARNARLTERVSSIREKLVAATPLNTAVKQIDGQTRLELRRESVLASVDPSCEILEIGPAHNAILPKRDGYRSRSVDYLDREGLIERYREFPQYSPDDIEEVDYVLAPGSAMAGAIADRFELVVASHVIEHTTSLIDFITECARLLQPGGVIALVVPDHRFTFDRFRERASLARIIDAELDPPTVHTVGTLIEERLLTVRRGRATAWHPTAGGSYSFLFDTEAARQRGELARAADRYIDAHHWVFTPHHLRLLLHDLADLQLIPVREVYFRDTVRHEFFINLMVEGRGPGLTREELMVLADDERRSLDPAEFGPPPSD